MNKKYHDALDDLLDRPIAFNPSFKKITKSTNAALLLSQGFYWSKRTEDPDGWFWKTRTEWMEETGMTEAELDGAREKCRDVGVMEEKLKGVPATLYYRVNKSKVYELLGVQIPTFPESGLPQAPQIPQNQESGSSENINRNTEITPEITTNKSVSLEWDLLHGMKDITQEQVDDLKQKMEAVRMFEKSFGFGTLPWGSNKIWEKLEKFVTDIYVRDRLAFGNYVIWRGGDGKYKAMSNKQIRMNPQIFMDTGWMEFETDKHPISTHAKPELSADEIARKMAIAAQLVGGKNG